MKWNRVSRLPEWGRATVADPTPHEHTTPPAITNVLFSLYPPSPLLRLHFSLPSSRRIENTTMLFKNVVGGKLKLKGRALDVKAGGIKKKKKRRDHAQEQQQFQLLTTGKEEEGNSVVSAEADPVLQNGDGDESKQKARPFDDHMTPAERLYHEQKAKLDARRLAKLATKSHRQRVEEFNQYLANLSEHYDIPKVGPG